MEEDKIQKIYGLINEWIFRATTGDITSTEENVLLRCAKDLIRVIDPDKANDIIKDMERML